VKLGVCVEVTVHDGVCVEVPVSDPDDPGECVRVAVPEKVERELRDAVSVELRLGLATRVLVSEPDPERVALRDAVSVELRLGLATLVRVPEPDPDRVEETDNPRVRVGVTTADRDRVPVVVEVQLELAGAWRVWVLVGLRPATGLGEICGWTGVAIANKVINNVNNRICYIWENKA